MIKQQKYLFVDRDGTLIFEPPDFQVDAIEKVKWVPGVIPALLTLQAAGFTLVMITNQDGLGSNTFPRDAFEAPQRFILETLYSQGINFETILICPHSVDDNCDCRKPKVGLVMDYLINQSIDRENSYVIGDRETDLQLARNMGIKGFLIDNGTVSWQTIVTQILHNNQIASLTRKTKETDIKASICLNSVDNIINTGIPFFDHMLAQLALHGGFGLTLKVKGDLEVDDHHTVEDTAIVLGQMLNKLLGDKKGIARYGFVLPLDEALASVALDLSGRSFFTFKGKFQRDKIGALSTECVPHFFATFAEHLRGALHIQVTGENTHHMIESMFKAVGRSLRMAMTKAGNELASTKGVL